MTNGEQDREIRLMRRALVKMDKKLAMIVQAVCGNGTKGLNQRITDLEIDAKGKPARDLARLGVAVTAGGVVFKGIDMLIGWLRKI